MTLDKFIWQAIGGLFGMAAGFALLPISLLLMMSAQAVFVPYRQNPLLDLVVAGWALSAIVISAVNISIAVKNWYAPERGRVILQAVLSVIITATCPIIWSAAW